MLSLRSAEKRLESRIYGGLISLKSHPTYSGPKMVEIIGDTISGDVDAAVRRLVNAQHFRAGSIVSMPVIYPSGASVVLEITMQKDRCFVTDRGGASQEAELFGATRYFKSEAERVALSSGIHFDGRDMFVAEVPRESLHGAMTVVANASAEAVKGIIDKPEVKTMPSVDVATVGRVAGASVFLLCLLLLVLWLSFGLFFIAPLFSILGCLLGGSFYLLSFSVRREWANRDGRADNRK